MSDESLRQKLETILRNGLKTNWQKRAYTSEEVNRTVAQLQELAPDDFESKLVTAGLTLEPYVSDEISQSCETCMYYLKHRRFCELPELNLPVEPAWSCILWRI